MKKILSVLVFVIFVYVVAGCTQKNPVAAEPTTVPTLTLTSTQVQSATVTPTVTTTSTPYTTQFRNGEFPDAGYNGTSDNWMYAGMDINYGSCSDMVVSSNGAGTIQRAIIAFDVSSIPAGSVVERVYLHLYLGAAVPVSVPINIFVQTTPWSEGIHCASAATAGDSNWTSANFGTSLWTTPGGDIGDGVLGIGVSGLLNEELFVQLNAAGTSAVQGWIDTPSSNGGLIIKIPNEAVATDTAIFHSSETASVSYRPMLEVLYR